MIDAQAQPYYGIDNNYQKSYGNDNYYYEPQYPSDNFKSKYSSSYEKDSYKKDVSINTIKCINTNLNINGNNAGNVSIGNKGQGYLGGYSSSSGEYGGEAYNNKQDKGFDCTINNNNTNNNIVAADGAGNVTETKCNFGGDKNCYLYSIRYYQACCRSVSNNSKYHTSKFL
jgi:hypothetical protein